MKWDPEAFKKPVLAAIPCGRKNAIKADDIQRIAGTPPEPRTQIHTRTVIRLLREDGYPICSSPSKPAGFWMPSDPDELLKTIHGLESRIRKIAETRRNLLRTYYRLGGSAIHVQLELFGEHDGE